MSLTINNTADLRKKSIKDLTKIAKQQKTDVSEFHHKKMVKDQGKDHNLLKKMKRELAKTLTILNEKKSEEAKEETAPKKGKA